MLGLVGEPVYVGVYNNPSETDDSEKMKALLVGTLQGVLYIKDRVYVTTRGTSEPGSIEYNVDTHYALITWKENDGR